MRNLMLTGLSLAIMTVAVLTLSSMLALQLQPFALIGLSSGAVAALAAPGSPLASLLGLAAGVLVAWFGFGMRAHYLPDSDTALTVSVAAVLLLCALVSAGSRARVPLWSVLLGAAVMAGSYELTYAATPADFGSTSLAAVSSLLVTAAAGYLAGGLFVGPISPMPSPARTPGAHRPDDTEDELVLDDLFATRPAEATR